MANMAESSNEDYGSKRAVLPMMIMSSILFLAEYIPQCFILNNNRKTFCHCEVALCFSFAIH
jgi:hypothetical protein